MPEDRRGATVLRARAVATPVLERAPLSLGRVVGATTGAAWIAFPDFVVAVTMGGSPLLPNGIALAHDAGATRALRTGAPAALAPGSVTAGTVRVEWDATDPPAWSPRTRGGWDGAPALGRYGRALLRACGVDDALGELERVAGPGARLVVAALAARDADVAAAAADALLGRGPGLTPAGDDALAAAAAVVACAGRVAGWSDGARAAWLAASCPRDAARRTTSLSATLLSLAARGLVAEPLARALDARAAVADAGARLLRLGHSTGRAYALAAGLAATSLAAPRTSSARPRRPPTKGA
ncbi:MAG TPA: DUF2877 domain-containing protein [Actinomycetota bacterium]|nr:DUF2877 domain-containing protein [Actinomycetota bacterium]